MRCGCGRSGTSWSPSSRSRSGSASARADGGLGSLGKTTLKSQRSSRNAQSVGVEIGAIVEAPEYMAERLPEDFRERAFRFTCKPFDYCEDLARIPGPA